MKFLNCKMNEMVERLRDARIIIFGLGEYFDGYVKANFPKELIPNIRYAVDSDSKTVDVEIGGRTIPVKNVSDILKEKDCTILLTSSNYMYEMYLQLEKMQLGTEKTCYAFPLILASSNGYTDPWLHEKIFCVDRPQIIEKTIHCFWFSGDKKPEAYQKCIESWRKKCPDYEIIEWNMDNYDYGKNTFMRQAIEKRKWAFASDYARLDVIYQMGGIYADMDVEILKSFNSLIGNAAFFTFDAQNDIDLGTFGAAPGNPFIKELMNLYEEVVFEGDMKNMNYFCQPRYIRPVLEKKGVVLNGNTQWIDGMAFLARNYLAPKDSVIYNVNGLSEETIAIHHFNAGWKDGDYRNQRIVKNRKLVKCLTENG